MYLRAQPTEGGLRIQSYSHSLTTEFMGDWSPATPTGLNTSHDYQPDGLVVWPYEGIYIGIGNVFNTVDTVAASGAVIGQVNMVLGWSAGQSSPLLVPLPAVSWPWVPAWGSLEPSRRAGENAQKTRKNGGKMGEIPSKRCGGSGGGDCQARGGAGGGAGRGS